MVRSGTGALKHEKEPPVDKRQLVMEAAVRVFSQRGYRATSMWDLARAVGLSKPSLYHYVSSKEALLVELYEGVTAAGVESARGMLERDDVEPADAIRQLLVERIEFTCDNRRLLQIFFEEEAEIPPDLTREMRRQRRLYEDALIELLNRAAMNGSVHFETTPRIAVNTLLGAAHWTYKWFDAKGVKTSHEVAEEIADILLNGLLTRP